MAPRGSKKWLSVEQEEYLAKRYRGKRSASSGAAGHDQGDIRTKVSLIEAKGQFGERVGAKPVRSTLVTQMEKIMDEAYSEMKDPAIALRFYMPDSRLANPLGFVDFVVRPLEDDLMREERLIELTEMVSGRIGN